MVFVLILYFNYRKHTTHTDFVCLLLFQLQSSQESRCVRMVIAILIADIKQITVFVWSVLFRLQKSKTSRCFCMVCVHSITAITQILYVYGFCYLNHRTHNNNYVFVWFVLILLQTSTKTTVFVWLRLFQSLSSNKSHRFCSLRLLSYRNHKIMAMFVCIVCVHSNHNVFVWFVFIKLQTSQKAKVFV